MEFCETHYLQVNVGPPTILSHAVPLCQNFVQTVISTYFVLVLDILRIFQAYEENKKQNERQAKLFNEKIRIANIFGVVIGLLIWIIITIYVIAHLTFLQQATSHFTAMAQNEAQIFYKDYRKPYDAEHP